MTRPQAPSISPKGEEMEKIGAEIELHIKQDPILKRMGFLFGIILATK